jgi:hypothetical protein
VSVRAADTIHFRYGIVMEPGRENHPSDEEISRYCHSSDAKLVARIEEHIRDCDVCAALIARIVRESERLRKSSGGRPVN